MNDKQKEADVLIERLFSRLDEQQRLIDSLFDLIDKLRATLLGLK